MRRGALGHVDELRRHAILSHRFNRARRGESQKRGLDDRAVVSLHLFGKNTLAQERPRGRLPAFESRLDANLAHDPESLLFPSRDGEPFIFRARHDKDDRGNALPRKTDEGIDIRIS